MKTIILGPPGTGKTTTILGDEHAGPGVGVKAPEGKVAFCTKYPRWERGASRSNPTGAFLKIKSGWGSSWKTSIWVAGSNQPAWFGPYVLRVSA